MPDSGGGDFESGAPIDVSGGGLDPSAYYALSPGGAFPGAQQNYLAWLSGVSRGTAGSNPDFELPDWLTNAGKGTGILSKFINWNAQNGGVGNPPTGFGLGNTGGYPYQTYSGPGAAYGPQGGPLSGLLDQGNPNNVDGPTSTVNVPPNTNKSPRPRGGGGGGSVAPNFTFTPYAGIGFKPSFVGWQPITPGTPGPYAPTQFVTPGGRAGPSNTMPAPGSGTPPAPAANPHPTGKWRGPNKGKPFGPRPGAPGAPAGPGGNSPNGPPGSAGGPGGPLNPDAALHGPGPNSAIDHRDPTFSGYNPNNLDKATPGWQLDPSTGINNTAGMGAPTLPAPKNGESWDDYYNQLHDLGLSGDTIAAVLGPYGYTQHGAGSGESNGNAQGPSSWSWGWGTGPVVGGPNDPGGYHFANQGIGPGGFGGGADNFGASGGGKTDVSGGGSGYYSKLAV